MARIVDHDGAEIVTDRLALEAAQADGVYDGPHMWDNGEREPPEDEDDEGDPDEEKTAHAARSAAHAALKAAVSRVYIDDPSEAPEGVEVQQGEQGGLFYEPGGGTGTTVDETDDPSSGEEGGGGSSDWRDFTSDVDARNVADDPDLWIEEKGSLSDFGFAGGVHDSMAIGAIDNWDGESNEGLFFENQYGPGKEDYELGQRQMVAYEVGTALGANIPEHALEVGDGQQSAKKLRHGGSVWAEGVEGWDVGEAPADVLDKVDEAEFYEQAAIQVIIGNNDAHWDNCLVTPEGDVVFHDIDHTCGDITGDFVGEKSWYKNALDRTLGELWRTGQDVVDADREEFQQRVLDRAKAKAEENFHTPEADNALTGAQKHKKEFTNNIYNNMKALKNDEVSLP